MRRWAALGEYEKSKNLGKLESDINNIIASCVENKHFEIARSCQFYLASKNNDDSLIEKLYFGTPFDSFRQDILNKFKNFQPTQSSYQHSIGEGSKDKTLDLWKGTLDNKSILHTEQLPLKALRLLFSDLFRPLSGYELFEDLFETEQFNPFTSLNKVKQVIFRLNQEFESQNLGLSLKSRKKNYFCESLNRTEVKLYLSYPLVVEDETWQIVQELAGKEQLTFSTLRERLGISKRKTENLLKLYREEGVLEKVGAGKKTSYQLKKVA
jgi:hypothetical protein